MSVFMLCGCKVCFQQTRKGRIIVSRIQQHSKRCLYRFISRVKAYTSSVSSWRNQIRRDPCCYCGSEGGTADHIIPQSDGGSGSWQNLTGACADCNTRKGSKSLLTFLMERHDPKP